MAAGVLSTEYKKGETCIESTSSGNPQLSSDEQRATPEVGDNPYERSIRPSSHIGGGRRNLAIQRAQVVPARS